jgi:hypothetical protein
MKLGTFQNKTKILDKEEGRECQCEAVLQHSFRIHKAGKEELADRIEDFFDHLCVCGAGHMHKDLTILIL